MSYVTTDQIDINDINIIQSWPGVEYTSCKIPTTIAYARENYRIRANKWGFEVNSKHISYSWMKLLLDRNAVAGLQDDPTLVNNSGSGMLKLPDFREAGGVCEDFLKELYNHFATRMRAEMTELIFEATPMECWITLPAIWSDEAKDATLNAARNAGFGNRPGDEVFTISEPEAAAIATLRGYSNPENTNPIRVWSTRSKDLARLSF